MFPGQTIVGDDIAHLPAEKERRSAGSERRKEAFSVSGRQPRG